MSKRVIFIEHDHVSEGGPIWHQFKVRGYEITRFIIVDKEHQKSPNVTVEWPDLLSFDVVVVMGAPYAAYGDDVVGNWLLPELEKMKEVHNAGIPVLGICFGGQLMSRVLGGTVSRSPRAELGWYEIESKDESLVPRGPWFQYHWDRFGWKWKADALKLNQRALTLKSYAQRQKRLKHKQISAVTI